MRSQTAPAPLLWLVVVAVVLIVFALLGRGLRSVGQRLDTVYSAADQ